VNSDYLHLVFQLTRNFFGDIIGDIIGDI